MQKLVTIETEMKIPAHSAVFERDAEDFFDLFKLLRHGVAMHEDGFGCSVDAHAVIQIGIQRLQIAFFILRIKFAKAFEAFGIILLKGEEFPAFVQKNKVQIRFG